MRWMIWALILIAQTGSNTWASRARNSGSIAYHSIASAFSNGVWFISNLFIVDSAMAANKTGDYVSMAALTVFYITFTVIGATAAHWASIKYLEKGIRRVGVHHGNSE